MLYAFDKDSYKIEPSKVKDGFCPICKEKLIAKCGSIVVHHWSHIKGTDCDPWYEPESEWHKKWKEIVDLQYREVVLQNHRADIHKNGFTIELQHSSISKEDILDRECFYSKFGKMIWLIDGIDFKERFEFRNDDAYGITEEKQIIKFRWKHARVSYIFSNKTKIIDFGEYLVKILWMKHYNSGTYGACMFFSRWYYLKNLMSMLHKL